MWRNLIIIYFAYGLVMCDLRSEFEERVDAFINATIFTNSCGMYENLIKLEFTQDFCDEDFLHEANKFMERRDGSDFNLAAISWLLNKYWDHPGLSDEFKSTMIESLLQLPFWLNETGNLNTMQYWSENHQIGWKSGKHLIGQAFANNPELKDLIFTASGQNGSTAQMLGGQHARLWFEYRSRFGFSEFNSDTYAPIAFKGIAAIVGLSDNPELKKIAEMVMNLQLFDHIIGSKGERLSTSRGRAYSEGRIGTKHYALMYLLKGIGGIPVGHSETTLLVLALKHGYILPDALLEIADEVERGTYEMRERFGLSPKEGNEEGLLDDNPEDCIFWFSNGAYFDPESPQCIFITGDSYDLWDRTEIWGSLKPFKPIWDLSPQFVNTLGQSVPMFGGGSTLGPANVYTFRTSDFMLSSTQNYRKGWVIGQQMDWQATLDEYRIGTFFSHQPLTTDPEVDTWGDYWTVGIHPKVGQFERTLISIFNPDIIPTLILQLKITHANFNKNQTDEFYSDGHWFIASQGSAYVGMFTYHEARYNQDSDFDLVADGIQNVWICKVGSKNLDGSFEEFKKQLLESKIDVHFSYNDSYLECLVDNQCFNDIFTLLNCINMVCKTEKYSTKSSDCIRRSQSEWNVINCLSEMRSDIQTHFEEADGTIYTFGWNQPLMINGEVVQDEESYLRYDNAFASVPWGSTTFNITSNGGHYMYLDFDNLTLIAN